MRCQVFALRRPELDAEALAQPRGIAGVIRVVVREDHALDRLKALEQLLPQPTRLRIAYAGVDDGPSTLVRDDPEVDMVERKRQRHAEPMNARRDFDGSGGLGSLRPGIL